MTDNRNHSILLEVNNLWKVFGKPTTDIDLNDADSFDRLQNDGVVAAVRNVSFKLKRGEVFVIMGLSGSGKSTLIRCIPRLIEPTHGEIKVNGRNVLDLDKKELIDFRRRETAMVFQHYGLLPHRNVIENVAFGLKLCGVAPRERQELAKQAIAQVGLEGWEDYYPAQLSGGMRQRVGIARALVQQSDLLLMDEPFSGLDPLIRREMQDTLIDLQKKLNRTILFVTHDLSEAIRLGDTMAVMRDGKFIQQGTPADIMNNPADEYVERFVQDARSLVPGSSSQALRWPRRTVKPSSRPGAAAVPLPVPSGR
ncbi:MAG: betaine/proline/choline family ABC transporter ATP-binding protein [Syntrophomonadaceae bacterium]|jgi:glycine betaine/proline transport system ATP-binding protein|nr:betaine/proline/choline family ABC transporter ATP-binding protein [Syntrophomonadaceae bacterium]